jgi:ABC-type branched-subunit amino acid transport system substrate-binding protein
MPWALAVLLPPVLLLPGGCKTLESRWPGPQEQSTAQILLWLDAGLPPLKGSPSAAAAATQPAGSALPWLKPPPSAGIEPPPPSANVIVDTAALPPAQPPQAQPAQPQQQAATGAPAEAPAGTPPGATVGSEPGQGAIPQGALAALMGRGPAAPGVPGPEQGGKVVALLLPLTGQAQALGQRFLDAAMLAAMEMGEDDFVLRPYDTTGSPEFAAEIARRAVNEGASLVLGPLFAAEAREVGQAVGGSNVGVLSFSNDRSVAGGPVNIMGFLPEAQVLRVVAYARQRRIERFAAMAPNNEYGQAIVNGLRQALEIHGGQLIEAAMYDPGAEDLTPVVRQLARDNPQRRAAVAQLQGKNDPESKAALRRLQEEASAALGYDALLVAESGQRLKTLAPLLPYYDIDPAKVKILGTAQWDEPGLGNEPALVGAWFAAPPPASHAEFEKRFEAAYKARPPRLASLAYDATALAAVIARTRGFGRDAIAAPSGYLGVDGIFRFRPDGVIERGLAVIEVQPRGVKVVDPAPSAFQAAQN